MSFNVDWNLLETESMAQWTKELLTETLNSGKRPNILASEIEIKDLNFGKIPPTFEILEIGELETDRFRGIFKINYDGDAHITLHTKVQANPLKIYSDNLTELEDFIGGSSDFIKPNFQLSNDEFSLPLDLKLSDIKISGIGIIVFSKTKGLTLVFRNDPLDSINVSSTFDMVQVLAKFLQSQIETQIRDLFRETLPTVLHKLSLKYISSNNDNFLNNLNLHNFNVNNNNEVVLFDLNNEFNNYSAKNLQKNLKLFNSRETLNLHIPKFKNVIQRSNLQKFNKKLSPNLLTSLSLINDNKVFDNNGSNGIPINFLVDKEYTDVQHIVKNISDIQSNNYYQKNVNNNMAKPKRRVIKLNRNKTSKSIDNNASNTMSVAESTLLSNYNGISQTSTMNDDDNLDVTQSEDMESEGSTCVDEQDDVLQQPRPLRLNELKQIHSHSHFHRNFDNSSPNNSNSSFLSGVGIGNNYFNFTNKEHVNPDEFKKSDDEVYNEVNEKSNNYLDVKSIKEKLNELRKLQMENHKHFYMEMPPPYQL
ncbi:hypothetical protein CANTEDRAFT_130852 [Yamadazyma tenuis ATCC 10573]|uniref:Mitochondrial distribution and morphology protein 34 n=1 Tax=Candida tenuis (strain ATCC 10573 / BCRC 21748 / CBS 615 / JCM 9827 / NBRC 10315 / NRRL Y-1498 / VKM Y-70) TaxID=590646 RepID=G3B647_CANTC|nr:uncharacterized protein CANTEDRAFT_130852 [Yamadazyma tenuis ATCC 10573]EGV63378.1 hypothetical protein CANTEDRAFT_130852 [Yamadazyma tenuis ATCC 10573]